MICVKHGSLVSLFVTKCRHADPLDLHADILCHFVCPWPTASHFQTRSWARGENLRWMPPRCLPDASQMPSRCSQKSLFGVSRRDHICRSQAKDPKQKISSERSQAKDPKRKVSSERFLVKVPKRGVPSKRS